MARRPLGRLCLHVNHRGRLGADVNVGGPLPHGGGSTTKRLCRRRPRIAHGHWSGTHDGDDREKPRRVTIRWPTRTYGTNIPCNHAVSLFDDGRILFHYGFGNDPITPRVGISAGDGVNYLLSTYNNATSLRNADVQVLSSPPPLPDGISAAETGTGWGCIASPDVGQPLLNDLVHRRAIGAHVRHDQRRLLPEGVFEALHLFHLV